MTTDVPATSSQREAESTSLRRSERISAIEVGIAAAGLGAPQLALPVPSRTGPHAAAATAATASTNSRGWSMPRTVAVAPVDRRPIGHRLTPGCQPCSSPAASPTSASRLRLRLSRACGRGA